MLFAFQVFIVIFFTLLGLGMAKWIISPTPAEQMEDDEEESEEMAVERHKEIQAWNVLQEIYDEWARANIKHKPLNSSHEALAVMQEEVFELQTEVYSNEKKNPLRMENMRAEAIQVGAMALRLVMDVCDKPTEVQ